MRKQQRRRGTDGIIGLCLSLAAFAMPEAGAESAYTITDLGANFQPLSINENGLISGIDNSGASPVAAFYRNGTLTPLRSQSYALDSNENNLIVGYQIGSPDNQALLWNETQLSAELSQFSGLLEARGISAFDEVVGMRLVDDNFQRAFHYDIFSGTLTTLATLGGGNAWANGINDKGQITGAADDSDGNTLAFRHDGRNLLNLKSLTGYKNSAGLHINEQNSIVGLAYNRLDAFSGKRAVSAPEDRGLINLGTLNHDIDSIARGGNNKGFIVGQSTRIDGLERAFLYDTAATDIQIINTDPVVPTTIYTGSTRGGGVAKSSNRGQDWLTVDLGLVNGEVNQVTVHPLNNSRLFAATNGGIYVSNNGGNSWSLITAGIGEIIVRTVHVDNKDASRLLAGTDSGIYYSRDGGLNWSRAPETSSFGTFYFVSHPTEQIIFAATSSGVYRSIDKGESWDQNNGNGDTRLFTRFVAALAIDPNNSDVLYAGTFGGGVYKTTTPLAQSLEWERSNEGMEHRTLYGFAIDASSNPSTLFAATDGALYSMKTNQASWSAVDNFSNTGIYSLALANEGVRTTLYLTTFDGRVFRSDSDTPPLGSSWTSITRGVSSTDVYALTAIRDSKSTKSKILAGTSNGVFSAASNDAVADTRWNLANSGASGFKVTTLAFDDRPTPRILWAGSSDQGIYVSQDDGQTWLSANSGLDNLNIYDIEVDTTTVPPIVYAASLNGVYRSSDGGINWSASNNGLSNLSVYSLLLDTSVTPKILYAGTANGVFRSSDQGRNWVPLNIGLAGIDIVDLMKNPADNKTIIAASLSAGLFRSLNQGQSWESLNSGLADAHIFDIDHDNNNPGTFIAATPSGVYKLSNAFCSAAAPCWNWQLINNGLQNSTVFAVAFNPEDSNQLFAGTDTNGAYKSTDGGATWAAISEGLSSLKNRMQPLNTLIDNSNWDLRDASAIDNQGHIIGTGYLNGEAHGYLLTPILGTTLADLSVQLRSTPDTLKPNIPMTFEITVVNNGPDAATNIQLTNWLPPNVLYRHSSTSQGVCRKQEDKPLIRCSLGILNAGSGANISIFVEPQEADLMIRNITRARADERDPDFSNNSAGAETTITIDRCFIATAAYGSFLHPHVGELRAFRDNYLLGNRAGRYLVGIYYEYSPALARFISQDEKLMALTRLLLAPIVYALLYPLWFGLGVILLGAAWFCRRRLACRLRGFKRECHR